MANWTMIFFYNIFSSTLKAVGVYLSWPLTDYLDLDVSSLLFSTNEQTDRHDRHDRRWRSTKLRNLSLMRSAEYDFTILLILFESI